MEPVGNIGVELRREGLVVRHSSEYHTPWGYDSLEVSYKDVPDLIKALIIAAKQEGLALEEGVVQGLGR